MKKTDKMKTIGKRIGVDFGKDNDTEVYDFLIKKGYARLAALLNDPEPKPKDAKANMKNKSETYLSVMLSGYLTPAILDVYLQNVKENKIDRLFISYFRKGELGRESVNLYFSHDGL